MKQIVPRIVSYSFVALLIPSLSSAAECFNDCSLPDVCSDLDRAAHPSDCNAYFLCNFGQWVELGCEEGYYFNSLACECEAIDSGNCLNCVTTTEAGPVCVDGCDIDLSETCEHDRKAANAYDCTMYWLCYFGDWVQRSCEFYFNNETCTCDVTNIGCINCGTTEPPTTTPRPGCVDGCDIDLSENCEHDRKAANAHDCTRYWLCYFGDWVERSCEFYFNNESCTCEETNIGCIDCGTTLPPSTTPRPGCVDGCDLNIRDPCEHDRKAANVDDCTKYWLCYFGDWVQRSCENYFNNETCLCDSDTAGCLTCPAITTLSSTVSQSCPVDPCSRPTECVDGDRTADPNNCDGYYYCNFGNWIPITCPEGDSFDSYACLCIPQNQAVCYQCPSSCPVYPCDRPVECSDGDRTSDPDNCESYWYCNFGNWVSVQCPDGDTFDSRDCLCVNDGDAICQQCPVAMDVQLYSTGGSRNTVIAVVCVAFTCLLLTMVTMLVFRNRRKIGASKQQSNSTNLLQLETTGT